MIMDWKGILRSIIRPREVIKPLCPIHRLPMERIGSGLYRCPEGHEFDPLIHGNKVLDPMIDATKGDFHGDL